MTITQPFTEQDRTFAQLSAERYAENKTDANRTTAYNCYQKLVPSCLKAYQAKLNREDYAELLQEGRIGLLKALDRYDPTSGNRFSTLAVRYITGYASHFLERSRHAIRIPANVQAFHVKLEEVSAELAQKLNRDPSTSEIAERLGVTTAEIDSFYTDSPFIMQMSLSLYTDKQKNTSTDADVVVKTPTNLMSSIILDNLFDDVDIHDRLSIERDPLRLKRTLGCSTDEAVKLIELCSLA